MLNIIQVDIYSSCKREFKCKLIYKHIGHVILSADANFIPVYTSVMNLFCLINFYSNIHLS